MLFIQLLARKDTTLVVDCQGAETHHRKFQAFTPLTDIVSVVQL
jgi:hypothetical protein